MSKITLGVLLDQIRATAEDAHGEDALTMEVDGAVVAINTPGSKDSTVALLRITGMGPMALATAMQNLDPQRRLVFFRKFEEAMKLVTDAQKRVIKG